MRQTIWLSLAGLVLLVGTAARADSLTGSSVNGSLTFSGSSSNNFNPSIGSVPAGYGNASGTTVTIGSPLVEFGDQAVQFGVNEDLDTANFTGTSLTISDLCEFDGCVGNNTFTMTFVDTAFTGLTATQVSDTFALGDTWSLVGNKLTVTVQGFPPSYPDGQTDSVVIDFASPSSGGGTGNPPPAMPEPSTLVSLASGLMGLFGLSLKKKLA
jgi:hypothetical protein